MLTGEYKYIIDSKKRLALPVKFRKELGKQVIVTEGFDGCLSVYSQKEWEVTLNNIREKMPSGSAESRKFNRVFLGKAAEIALDKLGRILIPDYLKKYAGLEKNVTVCGLGNKLEIWDSKRWSQYQLKAEPEKEKIAENFPELRI